MAGLFEENSKGNFIVINGVKYPLGPIDFTTTTSDTTADAPGVQDTAPMPSIQLASGAQINFAQMNAEQYAQALQSCARKEERVFHAKVMRSVLLGLDEEKGAAILVLKKYLGPKDHPDDAMLYLSVKSLSKVILSLQEILRDLEHQGLDDEEGEA